MSATPGDAFDAYYCCRWLDSWAVVFGDSDSGDPGPLRSLLEYRVALNVPSGINENDPLALVYLDAARHPGGVSAFDFLASFVRHSCPCDLRMYCTPPPARVVGFGLEAASEIRRRPTLSARFLADYFNAWLDVNSHKGDSPGALQCLFARGVSVDNAAADAREKVMPAYRLLCSTDKPAVISFLSLLNSVLLLSGQLVGVMYDDIDGRYVRFEPISAFRCGVDDVVRAVRAAYSETLTP